GALGGSPTGHPTRSRRGGPADGFLAVAPRGLRAGAIESISVSLFSGDEPAGGDVQVALLKDGQPVATAGDSIAGRGQLALAIPALTGEYELRLAGAGAQAS